jgi:hypothetical protein
MQGNLEELQNRAGNFERNGKTPPDALIKEIESVKAQVAIKTQSVEKQEETLRLMEERFESDLKRFRELKQGRAPSK